MKSSGHCRLSDIPTHFYNIGTRATRIEECNGRDWNGSGMHCLIRDQLMPDFRALV